MRRGGRHRSDFAGKEYAESSAGVAEKMETSLPDCGEQQEVPFLEAEDGNEDAEVIPYIQSQCLLLDGMKKKKCLLLEYHRV